MYQKREKSPDACVSKSDSQGQWFSVRTQHTVMLPAMIYYNERTQSKVNRGKGTWGGNWRKTGERFQNTLPVESHRIHISFPNKLWQHIWIAVNHRILRDFISDWSCRLPLPGRYQNSRLLERKYVSGTNHVVCIV